MTATNKTIILVREPGVDLPEAYIRKVLTACPNGGGYSVQSKNDKGEPELITDNMNTAPTLDDVQELLKGYSSHRILLAFNKLEKTDEKFLQPYHVAIDGDDILLSFGIDGTFPAMIEAGSTEESLFAQRVMFPNIQKLIKFSGGDQDKFLAELRDPTFVEMVMSRIGDRGAFCFLLPTGEPIWLGKNTLGSTFPWGQVSDTLGYTETPAAATSAVTNKKAGWWGKSKGPSVPVAQEPAPAAPEKPAAPPPTEVPKNDPKPAAQPDTKVNPPPATPTEAPATPPPGHWEAVPKGINRDQRKKLIRRVTNCGPVLPENWDKDPFYYWVAEYPQNAKLVGLARKAQVMKAETAAASAPSPKSGKEIAAQRDQGDPLMLNKDELTAIEEHILRVLGKISKTPPDLLANQKAEEKYAKFSQQFGVKPELLHNWTPADIRLLGPKGLFHYALELRRNDINAAAGASPAEVQNNATEALKAPATSSAPASTIKGWGKKPKAA